jgi:polar amino acid transport system substrate-binding protein|tara:strand:+ start:830 stop:1003 length:174 start_codon:yes stop_codon:yes gene_type:complete
VRSVTQTRLPSSLHFAASKQLNPQTAKIITDRLNAIKESGEYQQILNKWQLPIPTRL